jgi:hypothetical protein
MPFLHLQGRWLDRAGFAIGATVLVSVFPGHLVLKVVDPESTANGAEAAPPRPSHSMIS